MLKNVLKNFQMSEQNWSCLDKMSEVNFSPAETLQTLSGIPSGFQTVWIQIRPAVCKGYQQMALGGKELKRSS